jgi:O-antigen/teichoic acid export membrane protein
MADSNHSIGTRTLRGVLWGYGSFTGGRMLSLIATAILARVLVPEDFGLVAIALTFMTLLDGATDLGLSQALITQDDEVVEERADTVFLFSVGLGLVASAVIAALGPAAASFFDESTLTVMLPVLGVNFFLRSIGSTHYALAQRDLNFQARTIAEFADVVVRGLAGIAFALAGLGAWSLVLGYLVGTIALDVAIWRLIPWRPRFRPKLAHLRGMVGFGGTISGVTFIAALIANMDYLFIGRVLGTDALGLYTLGFRLPELLIINLSVVASTVLFPAFSSIERDSLGHAYLVALRYVLIVALPTAVVIAVLARPLILALFGNQWVDSIEPMQLLTLYSFAVAASVPAGIAYKATGRAGILLKIAVVSLVLTIVGLLLFVDRGINAVALVQIAVAAGGSLAQFVVATRLLGVGVPELAKAAWPAVIAGALMAVPMYVVEQSIEAPWPALLVGLALGAVVYFIVLRRAAPETFTFLKSKLVGSAPEVLDELTEEATRPRETDVLT